MAKATKAVKRKEGADTERDPADAVEEQSEEMRRLASQSGTAGGTVAIFRKLSGSRDKYLRGAPLGEVAEDPYDYLSEHFGGGTYRLMVRDEARGFVKGMGSLLFDVDGPPKLPKLDTPETRKLDELEAKLEKRMANGGAADMSTADMVRMMLELTREQLRELRNPPPAASQGNPAEMAVALATAMQQSTAPLLTAIVERASQPAPDMVAQLTGMLELMRAVREMSAPPEASGWDRIADRLASPLGSLLTQHVENQANGTAPPATMGGAGPSPNPPGADMSDRPAWYPLLRPHLPHLIQLAAAGRNPEVSADFIADSIPDQYIPVIYESLSRPTFQDELVAHVPEVGPHRPWFGAFAARVLEWFSPPSDDADAAGAPPEIGTGVAPEGDEG
jgi:hypothetical protein